MIRRDKFAIACLTLLLVAGLVGLSSCGGGGGGGGSRDSGDEIVITPPGDGAPVVRQSFGDVALERAAGETVQWESEPLETYFSDPDNGPLEFSADLEFTRQNPDASANASAEIMVGSSGRTLTVRVTGPGVAIITVTAQDSAGLTATQKFTLTVRDRSSVPVDRHSDTPAGATDIVIGRAIEGYINSPEDVDYFRFTPPDSGIYQIALDSDIPGVELVLLDDGGNVIATDQTESVATLVVVASVGLGLIAIMNKDADLLEEGVRQTPEGLLKDIALLGVDQVFSYGRIATKAVLPWIRCRTDICKAAVGVAVEKVVRYTLDITNIVPLSKQLEELVFLGTQDGEGCQARVAFNEQGFFTPSRYISTQFSTSSYSGACRNGRANGQGTYTASDTGKSLTYTGAWVDGEPRGSGDWHISDSSFGVLRYNGEWRSGQPNGQGTGTIEFSNGNDWRYTGAWVGGNPHGQGTWTAVTNGDRYRYVGAFRNGLQHGSGTETNTYANGDRERLVGEFRFDDLWNGTATWNGVSCRVVNGVDQC